MIIYDLLKWAIRNRVIVTFDDKNGQGRFEIDGRLFRTGTFQMIFKNGKCVRRKKVDISDWSTDQVANPLWLHFKKFGHKKYTSRPHWEKLSNIVKASTDRRLSYADLRDI